MLNKAVVVLAVLGLVGCAVLAPEAKIAVAKKDGQPLTKPYNNPLW